MTSIILYQVVNGSGSITNQWLSTDHGPDYYESCFGQRAWTEQIWTLDAAGKPVLDANGQPTYTTVQHPATFSVTSTDLTATSRDPRMQALRRQRDALVESTKWIQERHQDESALGLPTTVSATTYAQWLQYWQALRALPDSSPDLDSIPWPVQPPTKG